MELVSGVGDRLTTARASGLTIITAPKVKDRASTAQATPRRARAQGGLACCRRRPWGFRSSLRRHRR